LINWSSSVAVCDPRVGGTIWPLQYVLNPIWIAKTIAMWLISLVSIRLTSLSIAHFSIANCWGNAAKTCLSFCYQSLHRQRKPELLTLVLASFAICR